MKITYFGHSCFKIESDSSFLFDPYSGVGYEMEKTSADVVLCSHFHGDHHAIENVDCSTVLDAPVSGNFGSIKVDSITTAHDDVNGAKRGLVNVYKVECEGKTVVHLGDIGSIDEKVVEFAKNCDVLFIPIGGFYTIDPKTAKVLIEKIQPKIAIPMHFKSTNSAYPISTLEEFTSLFDKVNYVGRNAIFNNLRSGINVFLYE